MMSKHFRSLWRIAWTAGLLIPLTGCFNSESFSNSESLSETSYQGCLTATPLDTTRIRITFDFPANAKRIAIYRDGALIASSTVPSINFYVDTKLNEGQTYRYTCEAIIDGMPHTGSNIIELSTNAFRVPDFDGIATAVAASTDSIRVTWKPAAPDGVPADYYKVYILPTAGALDMDATVAQVTPSVGTTEHVFTQAGDELPYAFGVRACTAKNICDRNTKVLRVTLPDTGAPKTQGITKAELVSGKAQLTVPWDPSLGAIKKRRIYQLETTDGIPSTNINDYTLIRTDEISNLMPSSSPIIVDNLTEKRTIFFIVRDEDPTGQLNANVAYGSVTTTDLTPPVFAGIEALVNAPLANEPNYDSADPVKAEHTLFAVWRAIDWESNVDTGATRYVVNVTEGVSSDPCTANPPLKSFMPDVAQPYLSPTDYKTAVSGTSGNLIAFPVTGLNPRTTYRVCVKAEDLAGNSSVTTKSLWQRTKDQTAFSSLPYIFAGASTAEFSNGALVITWTPVADYPKASDTRDYRVKIWRGTSVSDPTSLDGIIKEFRFNHAGILPGDPPPNGFTFSNNPRFFNGSETAWVSVDACDNASPDYNYQDNCSSTTALAIPVLDTTPPPDFLGVNSGTLANVRQTGTPDDCKDAGGNLTGACKIEVGWLKGGTPGDWTDYAGFKIYQVTDLGDGRVRCDPLPTAAGSNCTCDVNFATAPPTTVSCPTSCKVSVKEAYQDIAVGVTAYDPMGNETICDTSTTVGHIRTLDQVPPTPVDMNSLSAGYVDASNGVVVRWGAMTDKQYVAPGVNIEYRVYRKTGASNIYNPPGGGGASKAFLDTGAELIRTEVVTDFTLNSFSFTDPKSQLSDGETYHYAVCGFDTDARGTLNADLSTSRNGGCFPNAVSVTLEDTTAPTLANLKIAYSQSNPNPTRWTLSFNMADNINTWDQIIVRVWRKEANSKMPEYDNSLIWPQITDPPLITKLSPPGYLNVNQVSEREASVSLNEGTMMPNPPSGISQIPANKWVNYVIQLSDGIKSSQPVRISAWSGRVFMAETTTTISTAPAAGEGWLLAPGATVIMQRKLFPVPDPQIELSTLELTGDSDSGGSTLTHPTCTTTECYGINIKVTGDLGIDYRSAISADGKGYLGGTYVGYYGGNNSGYTYGTTPVPGAPKLPTYSPIDGSTPTSGYHAGFSADQYGGTSASKMYGDFMAPIYPGTGGAAQNTAGSTGAHGGGVVRLDVVGTIYIDGRISADGQRTGTKASPGIHEGNGAGGSVYLKAYEVRKTLGQKPSIRANGGDATPNNGAGGGRVALYATTFTNLPDFSFLEAAGTKKMSLDYYDNIFVSNGGPGTIYVKQGSNDYLIFKNKGAVPNFATEFPTLSQPIKNLILDNGAAAKQTNVNSPITVQTSLTIQNGAKLYIPSDGTPGASAAGHTFSFSSMFTNGQPTQPKTWFTPPAGTTAAVTPYFFFPLSQTPIDDSNLASFGANWTISYGEEITLNLNHPITLDTLEVQDEGELTHGTCSTTACSKVDINARVITVRPLGRINATMKGYVGGYQPGTTDCTPHTYPNVAISSLTSVNCGNYPVNRGGYSHHGGLASDANSYGYRYGTTYGDFARPTTPGTGAISSSLWAEFPTYGYAANGGGTIHLIATETITVDGKITANGGSINGKNSSAGGSVWIEARGTLRKTTGSPVVSANGGVSQSESSGGGGRVSLCYGTQDASIPNFNFLQAYGGTHPSNNQVIGSPGSVFYKKCSDPDSTGTLIYDNNGRTPGPSSSPPYTAIKTPMALPLGSTTVANLIIRNGARVQLESIHTALNVTGTTSIDGTSYFEIPDSGAGQGGYVSQFPGHTTPKIWFTSGAVSGTVSTYVYSGPLLDIVIDDSNVASYQNSDWIISNYERVSTATTNAIPINSLTVKTGGILTHQPCKLLPAPACYRVNLLIAGNATIEKGGTIDVRGKGYLGGMQSDNTTNRSYGSGNSLELSSSYCPANPAGTYYGSGSHAGPGRILPYCGSYPYSYTAPTYGDFLQPFEWGGGTPGTITSSASGGGVIKLIVNGTLTLNGTINAGGGDNNYDRELPGAGGSAFIITNSLTSTDLSGSPFISAAGGSGPKTAGGAGGGRLALYYGAISAFNIASPTSFLKAGGSYATYSSYVGPNYSAGSGTVYFRSVPSAPQNTPPASPVTGKKYLVGRAPTDAWTGYADQVAIYDGAVWNFSNLATDKGALIFDNVSATTLETPLDLRFMDSLTDPVLNLKSLAVTRAPVKILQDPGTQLVVGTTTITSGTLKTPTANGNSFGTLTGTVTGY